MTEFNLEKAKSGQALCTRAGKAVRFLKIDRRFKTYPVVVKDENGHVFNVSPRGQGGFWKGVSEGCSDA